MTTFTVSDTWATDQGDVNGTVTFTPYPYGTPVTATITSGVLTVTLSSLPNCPWLVSFSGVTWNGFAAGIGNIAFQSPADTETVSLRALAGGALLATVTSPLQPPVSAGGGGGLSAVADDTAPTLGGDLDLNGFDIDGDDADTFDNLSNVTTEGWNFIQSSDPDAMRDLISAVGVSDVTPIVGIAGDSAVTPLVQNDTTSIPGLSMTFDGPPGGGVIFTWSVWVTITTPATLVAYVNYGGESPLFDWVFDTASLSKTGRITVSMLVPLEPGAPVTLTPMLSSSAADSTVVVTSPPGVGYSAWAMAQPIT